jgi:hypothetical protein
MSIDAEKLCALIAFPTKATNQFAPWWQIIDVTAPVPCLLQLMSSQKG